MRHQSAISTEDAVQEAIEHFWHWLDGRSAEIQDFTLCTRYQKSGIIAINGPFDGRAVAKEVARQLAGSYSQVRVHALAEAGVWRVLVPNLFG